MKGFEIRCTDGIVASKDVLDSDGIPRADVLQVWLRVGADPCDVDAQVLVRDSDGRAHLETSKGRRLSFVLRVEDDPVETVVRGPGYGMQTIIRDGRIVESSLVPTETPRP